MPNATTAFLTDPDQAARRAELAAFIGPNAERFLKTYDGMQARAVTPKGQKPAVKQHLGFVVMAFFLGPAWFFYRKLWAYAVGIVVLEVVLGLLPVPRQVGFIIGIVLSTMGQMLYVTHAIGRITAMRGPTTSLAELAQAGGVSKLAGWISGVLFGLLIVLTLAAIVYLIASGADPDTLR